MFGLVLATVVCLGAHLTAAGAASKVSPTPSPSIPAVGTSVTIDLQTDGRHRPDSYVLLIANLSPDTAGGAITLYDGSTQIASGVNYAIRWSYQPSILSVGTHHFTVHFTPNAGSGYRPSQGSADYVVDAPASTLAPTPTVTDSAIGTAAPSATPTITKKPSPTPTRVTDSQPATGTIPSTPAVVVSASGGTRTPSAGVSRTPTPVTSASGGTRKTKHRDGSLPFTGFDAVGFGVVAVALIGVGVVMLIAGRRRRGRTAPTHAL
jgi:hypothetical protein